ncbi:MAG: HEPN domain-containing protein [Planctomycetes bacterium]|nr:HEPN domain-containing protein [Planctomycetota bacterium]
MKPITQEWVDKAEGDWVTASREYRAKKQPNHDATCFHGQQCIERYLKAILIERGTPFPKMHDLNELQKLFQPADLALAAESSNFKRIGDFAVAVRYPGPLMRKPDAAFALLICARVRKHCRKLLGLATQARAAAKKSTRTKRAQRK